MKNFYFFLYLLVQICFIHSQKPIPNCIRNKLVWMFDSVNYFLDYFCEECQREFVVSFDMQQCVHYKKYYFEYLKDCRRMAQNLVCAEAEQYLHLDEDNNIIEIIDGIEENCAQFSLSQGKCIRPRFPFTLLTNTNTLTLGSIFCQFQDDISSPCAQYFANFFRDNDNGIVILKKFKAPDKLVINFDYKNIKCVDGFLFSQTSFGCFPQDLIQNCQVYQDNLCVQCESQYSLELNGLGCEKIEFCKRHIKFLVYSQCVECQSNYRLENNACKIKEEQLLKYCLKFDISNQKCLICQSPYIGEDCNVKSISGCDIYIPQSKICIKYSDNDNYYADIFNKTKEKRSKSLNCLKKHPFSDQCLTLKCKVGYKINLDALKSEQYYYHYQNEELPEDIQKALIENLQSQQIVTPLFSDLFEYYTNLYLVNDGEIPLKDLHYKSTNQMEFCIKRSVKYIEGCYKLNSIFDSCDQCFLNYQKVLNQGEFQNIVCKQIPKNQQIQNCNIMNQDLNSCNKCMDTFIQEQNNCKIGVDKYCLKYRGNQCQKCQKYYKLSGERCIYNFDCCQMWDSNNQCLLTSPGYSTQCTELNRPNHCINNQCDQCQSGYMTLNNLKCIVTCDLFKKSSRENYESKTILVFEEFCNIGCSINQYISYNKYYGRSCSNCSTNFIAECKICYESKCLKCVDGYGYSQQKQGCVQVCPICQHTCFDSSNFLALEQNECSKTQQQCDQGQAWSVQNNKCMHQCEQGYLVENLQDCSFFKVCQQGLVWDKSTMSCLFQCQNGTFSYDQQDCCDGKKVWSSEHQQCMVKCDDGQLQLEDTLCKTCPQGFNWIIQEQSCMIYCSKTNAYVEILEECSNNNNNNSNDNNKNDQQQNEINSKSENNNLIIVIFQIAMICILFILLGFQKCLFYTFNQIKDMIFSRIGNNISQKDTNKNENDQCKQSPIRSNQIELISTDPSPTSKQILLPISDNSPLKNRNERSQQIIQDNSNIIDQINQQAQEEQEAEIVNNQILVPHQKKLIVLNQ